MVLQGFLKNKAIQKILMNGDVLLIHRSLVWKPVIINYKNKQLNKNMQIWRYDLKKYNMCLLCEWDSRVKDKLYKVKNCPQRKSCTPGLIVS